MKKNKINLFDLLMVAITCLLIVLTMLIYYGKSEVVEARTVIVTLRINFPEQAETIYEQAVKEEEVYINSVNRRVKTKKVEKVVDEKGQIKGLEIEVVGPGEIGDRFIFNGQRVLIGQKAEIHGNYFAPAVISNIRYE